MRDFELLRAPRRRSEADQPGAAVSAVCRRHGLSPSVFYRRRAVAQGGPAVALKRDAQQHRKIGYRQLTYMMVDAGVACVGESTVYQVLSDSDLLSRLRRSTVSSGGTSNGIAT